MLETTSSDENIIDGTKTQTQTQTPAQKLVAQDRQQRDRGIDGCRSTLSELFRSVASTISSVELLISNERP